jgi:polyhydroxyalkanoate synthesis regulator phasin
MRQEQVTSLRNLLSAVVPKGKLSPAEIDALVQYMAEVTKTEDEAIQRLSGILQNDLNGISTWKMILQVELLREDITDYQERLRTLERHEKSGDGKWSMVQAIFTSISFIAATIALLKAFGLLQLPWLS